MKQTVFAHVNSKKPRIEKDLLGGLHIYVKEPPLEGRANKAIQEVLAKYLGVAKSKVILIKGEKSKQKVFEIV